MSVNSKMTAIADAIRSKTKKTGKLTLDQMAADLKVPHIVNVSNDTVTADTLAEGVTAHDAAGNAITGTMAAGGGAAVETCTVNITFSWFSHKVGSMYKHIPGVWAIAFKDGDTGELSGDTYIQGASPSSTHADTSVTFKVLSGDCFGISHSSSLALVLDENASGDSKGFDASDIAHTIVYVTSDCSITFEEVGSSDGPSMPG